MRNANVGTLGVRITLILSAARNPTAFFQVSAYISCQQFRNGIPRIMFIGECSRILSLVFAARRRFLVSRHVYTRCGLASRSWKRINGNMLVIFTDAVVAFLTDRSVRFSPDV